MVYLKIHEPAKNKFLKQEKITPEWINKLNALKIIAGERGQTLAQMALSWVLKDDRVTSVIVGSRLSQSTRRFFKMRR